MAAPGSLASDMSNWSRADSIELVLRMRNCLIYTEWQRRTSMSCCSKQAITGVAEPWHDVTALIKPLVQRDGEDAAGGVVLQHALDADRRGEQCQHVNATCMRAPDALD